MLVNLYFKKYLNGMLLTWTDEDCILNFDAETPFGNIQNESGERNGKPPTLGLEFARMEDRRHWFRIA
jgi:hypothetical protein